MTFAAIIFLLGIYLGNTSLIIPLGSTWAVPISAVFSLFLSGISILCLLFRKQFIANFFGLVILIVGGWRLLELYFQQDLGHTHFFHSLVSSVHPLTYPMASLGAANIFLIGLILLIWRSEEKVSYRVVRLFLAQLIVAFGSIGLLSYILPLSTSLFWENSPSIHLYIAGCQVLLGIALIATAFYYNTFNRVEVTKVLPSLVTVILFCFAVLLCLGLEKNRKETIDALLNSRGRSNIEEIKLRFDKYLESVKRMSKRIENSKAPPTNVWEVDVQGFINSYPEFRHVLWLDPKYNVSLIIPKNINGRYLGRPIPLGLDQRGRFEEAMKDNTDFFIFDSGTAASERNIQVYTPVFWDQLLQGVVGVEIDVVTFFGQALQVDLEEEFSAAITYGDEVVFELHDKDIELKENFGNFQGNFTLGTLVFTLKLYPEEHFHAGILNNSLLYFTLFGGILIAVSVGGLLALIAAYRERVVSLNELQTKMNETQYNLTTSLQSGGIGTWIWHILEDKIELDRQGQALFGYEFGTFPGYLSDILERTYPQDRQLVEHAMRGVSEDETSKSLHFQFRVILPNGSIRFLEAKGSLFQENVDKPQKAFGSLWDVTKIKMTNLKLELSQEIIRVFSDASTLKEAAVRILRTLNSIFGTEVIVIWLWNPKKVSIECAEIVYATSVQTANFEKINRELLGKDLTIPNRILSNLQAFAVQNLAEIIPHYRLEEDSPDRLRSVVALPIFQGISPIGVIELFKRSPYVSEMTDEILNLAITVGLSLGEFIEKVNAKKAQEQLVSIVTYSADALFLLDSKGCVMNWNVGAEEIFGYTPEEIVGKPAFILLPPEKLSEGEALRTSVLMGRTLQHIELQCIRKNGKKIWIRLSASPIRDENGTPIYASVVAENITDKKEEENLIRLSEKKLQAIIGTTEDWIWEMDANHVFLYVSPSVTKILGYQVDELLHKDLLLFLFDEDRQRFEEEFENSLKERRGWRKQIRRWRHKDGLERWLESSAEPSVDENGQVVRMHGTDRDVTENLYDERSKNEFLSVISHELKTPLTSIHGALGLLMGNEKLPDESKELLTIAYRNSNRLKKLINDILDIQKFESKKLLFDLQPVSLDDAIKESVDSAMAVAKVQQKELILQAPLPQVVVNSDHERLTQLVGNLLSNAIKFSPPGSKVSVSMEIRGDRVRVSVSDQGKGIPKAFQPKVFEKFSRAETGDARTTPGTGLGLSICKGIVERCGGTIGFQSAEGAGTTFYFELPLITKVE